MTFTKQDSIFGSCHFRGRIFVDSEKIEAIMEWPTPRNVRDVRYFIGLETYYKRSIKGFSKIAHPITSLKRKNIKCVWSGKCEACFQQLKRLLTSDFVLKIVDSEKDSLVCIDACIKGLGGVLMQEGNSIFYESRKLNEHEKSYETHDLELKAIAHAPKISRRITY